MLGLGIGLGIPFGTSAMQAPVNNGFRVLADDGTTRLQFRTVDGEIFTVQD